MFFPSVVKLTTRTEYTSLFSSCNCLYSIRQLHPNLNNFKSHQYLLKYLDFYLGKAYTRNNKSYILNCGIYHHSDNRECVQTGLNTNAYLTHCLTVTSYMMAEV